MKLKELSKYRNFWLGCAMIAIVWYHFKLDLPIGPLRRFKDIGYGGVDICLLASGIGCYFSLKNDGNLAHFFKKRFFRLMPTYWVFILCWIAFRLICDPIPLWAALGNFLGIQYLSTMGMQFNWYISGIIVFYLLSPLLIKLVDMGKSLWLQLALTALVFLATRLFWGNDTYIIIASRLPVFYLGMVFGRLCMEDREIKALNIGLLAALSVAGLLMALIIVSRFEALAWSMGLGWYPFLLVAPGACIILTLLARLLERVNVGRAVLRAVNKLGDYSFELYLVHLGLFDVIMYAINQHDFPGGNLTWIAALFVTAALCFLLRRAARKLEKVLRRSPAKINT